MKCKTLVSSTTISFYQVQVLVCPLCGEPEVVPGRLGDERGDDLLEDIEHQLAKGTANREREILHEDPC